MSAMSGASNHDLGGRRDISVVAACTWIYGLTHRAEALCSENHFVKGGVRLAVDHSYPTDLKKLMHVISRPYEDRSGYENFAVPHLSTGA